MLAFLSVCALFFTPGEHELPPAKDEVATVVVEDVRPPIEHVRERLRARPREERQRLERHLEEFERLPAPERRRLLERARALRAQERSLGERDAQRGDPDAARNEEQSRAELRERFRQHGREVRAHLPVALRRRLELAPPKFRRVILEWLSQRREQFSLRALKSLRTRFGLSPEEIQRLERMPLADRLQELRELWVRHRAAERGRGPTAH